MLGRWLVVALLGASVLAQGIAAPQRVKGPRSKPGSPNSFKRAKAPRANPAPRTIGVITYDTGANNAGFFPQTMGINVGNRFNSDMGGPLLMTGQVKGATFFPQISTAFITVFGPPNAAGTAPNLGSFLITGLVPGTLNSADFGPVDVGPDFLVGAWLNGSLVDVGMDNMTISGQGFHAFQLFTHFPGAGTGFQAVPSRNALVRANVTVRVPVELMGFSVQ